jgi:putative SOS response-associated peptidase YedK
MGFDLWLTLPPRYNVAPSLPLACFRSEGGQRTAFVANWGFVPRWQRQGSMLLPNARGEEVDSTRAFRTEFQTQRCLVVVDGFYEWDQYHAIRNVPKQPYYFSMNSGLPMALAGLWQPSVSAGQPALPNCTIITTGPNLILQPFHDRMPVILASQDWAAWLDPQNTVDELKQLLVPSDPCEMRCWPVSKSINTTRKQDHIDGPECIEPIDVDPPPRQQTLF